MDTKHYYLPQTRTRVYMFAYDKEGTGSDTLAEDFVMDWREKIEAFRRPASASLEAFLLPVDDPRVIR